MYKNGLNIIPKLLTIGTRQFLMKFWEIKAPVTQQKLCVNLYMNL
jgi:hypothetical protein